MVVLLRASSGLAADPAALDSWDEAPAPQGLRHTIIYKHDDSLASGAAAWFGRQFAPGAPLDGSADRVLVLAGSTSGASHQPFWAGEARLEVDEALARLAGHRLGPPQPAGSVALFALWHIVITADRAGRLKDAADFIEWARQYASGQLDRLPIVWLLSGLEIERLAAELTPWPFVRVVVLPERLGESRLTQAQRMEMAGQVLADVVTSDLGGPNSPFLRDLCTPGRPVILGARAVRASRTEKEDYLTARLAQQALEATLLAPEPEPAEDEPLAAEQLLDALRAQAQLTDATLRVGVLGWKHELEAHLLPEPLASLTTADRAAALAAAFRRIMTPEVGQLARAVRALQATCGGDEALGVDAVKRAIAGSVGRGPGGSLAALRALRDAAASLARAAEGEEPLREPRLRLDLSFAAALQDRRRLLEPSLIWLLWGSAVGLVAWSLAEAFALPAVWVIAILLGPSSLALGACAWLRVAADQQEWQALLGLGRRLAAFCQAAGHWLALAWLPERQRLRVGAVAASLEARVQEWRAACSRLRREAELVREGMAASWALHLERPDAWERQVPAVWSNWTSETVFHALAGPLYPAEEEEGDPVVLGIALLNATPAQLDAAARSWARGAATAVAGPTGGLPLLDDPQAVLAELRRSALPLCAHPWPVFIGSPALPLAQAAAATAMLLPARQTEWASFWLIGVPE